jgi:multicomponent Na+:H+ antiporter subunit F
MTAFLVAGAVLVAGLLPAGVAVFRGDEMSRLAALEVAGVLVTLALAALAIGMGRPAYLDLAVAGAILSFGGGLVFARFLERWL